MKPYKAKITVERLNDGSYVVEIAIGGSVERFSYDSLDAIEENVPTLRKTFDEYEANLDDSEQNSN